MIRLTKRAGAIAALTGLLIAGGSLSMAQIAKADCLSNGNSFSCEQNDNSPVSGDVQGGGKGGKGEGRDNESEAS